MCYTLIELLLCGDSAVAHRSMLYICVICPFNTQVHMPMMIRSLLIAFEWNWQCSDCILQVIHFYVQFSFALSIVSRTFLSAVNKTKHTRAITCQNLRQLQHHINCARLQRPAWRPFNWIRTCQPYIIPVSLNCILLHRFEKEDCQLTVYRLHSLFIFQ